MADRKGNSVERYYASKKKRQKRKRVRIYSALILISIAVFITLSLTVFFNITTFEVSGNKTYSTEQIISSAGLSEGDNLFRLNKFKMIDQLLVDLPYLEEVTIYRRLPTTLCIEVKETTAAFTAYKDGKYVLLSDQLKILGSADKAPKGAAFIVGDTVKEIAPGHEAVFENGSEEIIKNIVAQTKDEFWTKQIGAVDVSQRYNLRLYYQNNRVKILLGNSDKLGDKLQMACEAIKKNSSSEYARIDITDGKAAYYRVLAEDEVDDITAMLLGKAKAKADKFYKSSDGETPDADGTTTEEETAA